MPLRQHPTKTKHTPALHHHIKYGFCHWKALAEVRSARGAPAGLPPGSHRQRAPRPPRGAAHNSHGHALLGHDTRFLIMFSAPGRPRSLGAASAALQRGAGPGPGADGGARQAQAGCVRACVCVPGVCLTSTVADVATHKLDVLPLVQQYGKLEEDERRDDIAAQQRRQDHLYQHWEGPQGGPRAAGRGRGGYSSSAGD